MIRMTGLGTLLEELTPLRTILVTGKGGVGKTTVAAATAHALARRGRRVLCAEMTKEGEVSSPLADAFGVPSLGDEPVTVGERLRAVAIAPTAGHQRFLRDVLPMRLLADAAMKSAAIRRFLIAAPTLSELGALYRLLELVRTRRKDGAFEHEVLVVDLPASGHALALAQVPEAMLGIVTAGPVADAVREGLAFLRDPTMVGTLVITLPETLPVSESLELIQSLGPHRIPLIGLVANRVPFDPFDDAERAALRDLLVDQPPLLGVRSVERIDRAHAALTRLRTSTTLPVTELTEVLATGPKTVHALASLLEGDGP